MQNNAESVYYHVGVTTAAGGHEGAIEALQTATPGYRATLLGGESRGNEDLLLFWVAGSSVHEFMRRVDEVGASVSFVREFVTFKTDLTREEILAL